jgi:hypothetical protein
LMHSYEILMLKDNMLYNKIRLLVNKKTCSGFEGRFFITVVP